jgi:flagellar biosynthesis protein FlhF
MKMKRYVAADMRGALNAIRDEQGPDAVILSTRRMSGGVEVCAAVDIELAAGQGTLAETAALKQLERDMVQQLEQEQAETAASGPAPRSGVAAASMAAAAAQPPQPQPSRPVGMDDGLDPADPLDLLDPTAQWSLPQPADAAEAASVGAELRCLRTLLEQQVAALAWNDFTRREPLKARALSDLARLGVERALALQIVGDLPPGLSEQQLQRMPYALLARRLQIAPPPAERHGALALIGPPGSGKTTTLAKLAARYVLEQDPANLLIISTDDERLGSHEQLGCLGRLLGVRVESVIGPERLAARIAALPGRCILIDTPGAGSRDAEAAAYYRALRAQCAGLTTMLVLPASAQSGVIDDAVAHFGPQVSDCCALTRVDEAVSIGGVLSALVHSRLPVACVCEGARIPEDLRPARAHQLVARAVELSRSAQERVDDDLLARRYGSGLHAAA